MRGNGKDQGVWWQEPGLRARLVCVFRQVVIARKGIAALTVPPCGAGWVRVEGARRWGGVGWVEGGRRAGAEGGREPRAGLGAEAAAIYHWTAGEGGDFAPCVAISKTESM